MTLAIRRNRCANSYLWALCIFCSANAMAEGNVTPSYFHSDDYVAVSLKLHEGIKVLHVAKYELTWKNYIKCVDEGSCPNPREIKGPINLNKKNLRDEYPMTSISPDDITPYLKWLGKKTGLSFRLPTEEEWIAIAKLSSGRRALFAKDLSRDNAYILGVPNKKGVISEGNDPRSDVYSNVIIKVGSYRPDKIGLYDIFGNAPEVVSDRLSRKINSIIYEFSPIKGGDVSIGGNSAEFDLINDKKLVLSTAVNSVGFRLVY